MTKRIRVTSKKGAKIRTTSRPARTIDPNAIEVELGAQPMTRTSDDAATSLLRPLRQGLAVALRSNGGRPSLDGASRRQKIPMADRDWSDLEKIAQRLQSDGINATAGQVAGQILRDAVGRFRDRSAPYPELPPIGTARIAETTLPWRMGASDGAAEPSPSTTYLVGAGVNRGLVDARGRELPLAKGVLKHMLESPRFSDAMRGRFEPLWKFVAKHWHLTEDDLRTQDFDIEECLTLVRLQRNEAEQCGDKEQFVSALKLEVLLGQMIVECFANDRGYEFSQSHRALGKRIYEERANVITFNYDTVLERLIEYASPAVETPFLEQHFRAWNPLNAYKVEFDEIDVEPGLSNPQPGASYYRAMRSRGENDPAFLKLHGSINWCFRSGWSFLTGRPVERDKARLVTRLRKGRGLNVDLDLDTSGEDLEVLVPLLITPVLNKSIEEHSFFHVLWKRARECLRRTRKLVIFGYSFPPADFHVRRLLREAFCERSPEELCIVNPDTGVVRTARDLCNFHGPVVVCHNLSEYLALPYLALPNDVATDRA